MEFILDTADLEAVKQLDELLTIDGVTTNPAIITRSGKQPEQVIKEFVEYLLPEQKFFVQVVSTDYEQMLEEARYICSLRPENTYVKIPVTRNGYKAIKQLKSEGLGVLATAIYSADEAFLAAMNGADYLAPYVNRMCNYGDGIGQVFDLMQMLETHGLNSKIRSQRSRLPRKTLQLPRRTPQVKKVLQVRKTLRARRPATFQACRWK